MLNEVKYCPICGANVDALGKLNDEQKLRENLAAFIAQEEQKRIEAAALAEEKKKKTKRVVIAIVAAVAVVAAALLFVFAGRPALQYKKAHKLLAEGQYDAAAALFSDLGDYEDSNAMVWESIYQKGVNLLEDNENEAARDVFLQLLDYKDTQEYLKEAYYKIGRALAESGDYTSAIEQLELADGYPGSSIYLAYSKFELAEQSGDYTTCYDVYFENCNYNKFVELVGENAFISAVQSMFGAWAGRLTDETAYEREVTFDIGADGTSITSVGIAPDGFRFNHQSDDDCWVRYAGYYPELGYVKLDFVMHPVSFMDVCYYYEEDRLEVESIDGRGWLQRQ